MPPLLLEQEKKAKQPTIQINKNNCFIVLGFGLLIKELKGTVRKFRGKEAALA